jgi:hypothetical protein
MRHPRSIKTDTFLLWLVVLLPSTGMMLLGAGSMSPGLLAACLVILGIELVSFQRIRTGLSLRQTRVRIFMLSCALLLLHAVFVAVLWGAAMDWLRLVSSLVSVMIVLLAAACMRLRLMRHSSDEVNRIFGYTAAMLAVLALRSMIGEPQFTPISHPRPVVVFIEPSHFAFTFLPFVGYLIVQARGSRRWMIAISAGTLGLMLGSTTLLAGLGLLLITCLPWWQAAVFGATCAAVGVAVGFDASFIVNRIVFSEDVQNLSNLVLLQGWERAWLAIEATGGLGVGFQQFGIWGPLGEFQELIYAIGGEYINLFDGGTTASKLVGEFGVFGAGLLLVFAGLWWKVSTAMRALLTGERKDSLLVFVNVAIVAIAVELFVRGVGYLSQGLFLFGIAFAGPPIAATCARATPPRRRRRFSLAMRPTATNLPSNP